MTLQKVGVRAVVENVDRFNSDMNKINRKIADLGRGMTQLGRTLSLKVTAPLLAFAAAATLAADSVDKAFNTIIAGTGATGEALAELEGVFRDVVRDVPTNFGNASSVIAEINTRLGFTGDALQDVTAAALEAGRILGTDATVLFRRTAQVLAAFGLEGDQAISVLDQMFVTAQRTGIPIDELARSLQVYGPVLTNLGFSLTETIAQFGKLNKVGVDSRRIIPGLNQFMRRLAEEGVTDLRGALNDVIRRIQETTDQSEALNIAIDALGAEGAQRFLVAVRQGGFELGELVTALETADGAIANTSEQTRDLGTRFQLLRNRVTLAIEPLGEELIKALDALIPRLETAIDFVADLFQRFSALPGPVKATILVVAGLAVVVGPLLIVVGSLVALIPFVIAGFTTLIPLVAGLGAVVSLLLGPIGLVVLAIGALAAAWAFNFLGIRDITKAIADFVIATFRSITDAVGAVIEPFSRLVSLLPGLPSIPGFQEGVKDFRGGMAVVGERGPELVHLPPGSSVIPTSRTTVNNVTANYSNPQVPQSIRLDLEALAMFAAS